MKKIISFVLMSVVFFIVGCKGCDDSLTDKVAAPQFSIVKGTNYDVVMSTSTKGAKIKYTTDGTNPTTSSTAEEADGKKTLKIDFFTKIKAFSYKKDYRDSPVVSYRLPLQNEKKVINYKTDLSVDTYTYSGDDCNGKNKVIVTYNGKGDDNQWFSGEDQILKYSLKNYDSGKQTEEVIYNGPGNDGKWFTSDDQVSETAKCTTNANGDVETIDYSSGKWTYSYDANRRVTSIDKNGSKESYEYDASGNMTKKTYSDGSYDEFTVVNNVTTKGYHKNSSGNVLNFLEYVYTNKDFYYTYEYDASGNPVKKTRFAQYGTDTQNGITDNTFDTSKNILTASVYGDINKTDLDAYYEYTYSNGILKERKQYSDVNKKKLKYKVAYEYDAAGKVSRISYYDSKDKKLEFDTYEYSGDITKMVVNKCPDASSFTINFDLEVEGDVNSDTGGTISMEGSTYDYNGDPVGKVVDKSKNADELLKRVVKKIKEIRKNTKLTDTALVINGKISGDIKIVLRSTESDNKIRITFNFNDYNDGEVIISGALELEIEGQIDVSGKITAAGKGSFSGNVVVTDANPNFSDKEFNVTSWVKISTGANGLTDKEIEYTLPGADGAWQTEDDKIGSVTIYEYNNNLVSKKSRYGKFGNDEAWETSDDVLESQILYTYSGTQLTVEDHFEIYGTYVKKYKSSGTDANWETVSDNQFDSSVLTFDIECTCEKKDNYKE